MLTLEDKIFPPKKEGQLWEECEKCGQDPCYMPLMLCDNCWPKE